MADDHRDEVRALGRVIEACQARAADLDMPALAHILRRAEASLASHAAQVGPPRIPRGPALSIPRRRIGPH